MKKLMFILLFSIVVYSGGDEDVEVLRRISSEANGKTGVGIYLIGTGESLWLNKDSRFPMQSVYKLPIGMAVLHMADEGEFNLDDSVTVFKKEFIGKEQHSPIRDLHPEGDFKITIRELVRYAVSESDGTASDVLIRLCGGTGRIMDYLKGIGVNGIRISDTEMEMGKDDLVQYRNWCTPEGAVTLLKILFEGNGLKPESRQLIFSYMTITQTGLKRLKGLLPEDSEVAHKTGSSGSKNGRSAATNDIGIIRLPGNAHLIVAVFVSDSYESLEIREGVIAKTARFAYEKFSGQDKCNCF